MVYRFGCRTKSPICVLRVLAILNSVEFDVTYIPETSENIKMVVVVKDESGAVIGASYQTLEKVKGITCEFSGSIDCKNANSLNVVVFDSDTDAIIYTNTIN